MKLKIKKSHLFLIIVIVFAVIFAWFNSDHSLPPVSKYDALSNCLHKAVKCGIGIPAVEHDFISACNQVYYYTGNATKIIVLLV